MAGVSASRAAGSEPSFPIPITALPSRSPAGGLAMATRPLCLLLAFLPLALAAPVTKNDLQVLFDLWPGFLPKSWVAGADCATFRAVACDSKGNVVTLNITGAHLNGTIPGSISRLKYLEYLDLSHNNLTGSIPDFKKLLSLRTLRLSFNKLTGSIPFTKGTLKLLMQLFLTSNSLTGPIPEGIGILPRLSYMSLANNNLTGSIPSTFGQLLNFVYLDLSQNQLLGDIPESIGFLEDLAILKLNGNQLTGSIPDNFEKLQYLRSLSLSSNQLGGPIPAFIGSYSGLVDLNLSDNFFEETIPTSFGALSALQYLNLSGNVLTGIIPQGIASLANLTILDLTDNQLTGEVPSSFPKAVNCFISYNYFTKIAAPKHGKVVRCPVNTGNCISSSPYCKIAANQRAPEECSNFCNVSARSPVPCSGHGYCYLVENGSGAACACNPNYQQGSRLPYTCVLKGK